VKVNPKIIFAGLAQNCESHLSAVFDNINRISRFASETAFIFIENDSIDNTKQIIQNFGANKNNFKFLTLDGLSQVKPRTIRLEFLRNLYLEIIKKDFFLSSFDLLVLMDMDEVNTHEIEITSLDKAIGLIYLNENIAGVFPNQIGSYYDMWAFRHHKFCPDDIWEEVSDYALLHQCSDQEAFSNTFVKKILNIPSNIAPIEVNSAFGGLGIYKLKFVLDNPNPYLGSKVKILETTPQINFCKVQICEHVHFHQGLRLLGGKLIILPELINGINKATINPSFFRTLNF
jgi:hypothetical protein